MKIAVLGAGAFGTALGGILADNGYDIDYYDSKVERESLSSVLKDAKYIILAVPSKAVSFLLPHLPKNIPMVVATKGILSDKIFDDFNDYMILSGPGFADDIKAGKTTFLTVTDARLKELFAADFLHFDETTDKKGVLMCGALKNVFALYCGLLGIKVNTPEWYNYLKETAKEMKLILSENGADANTVELVCGKGDLKLTCNLPSRNYEFGTILKNNPKAKPEKTVEGITALSKIKNKEIIIPENAKKLRDLIERSKEWD